MSWVAWQQLCRDKEFGGMGCRDLHFNLALLAKQGWCIIMNPKSLISKLYKARYFPDGDFFTTPIGSRPSATWRWVEWKRQIERFGIIPRMVCSLLKAVTTSS